MIYIKLGQLLPAIMRFCLCYCTFGKKLLVFEHINLNNLSFDAASSTSLQQIVWRALLVENLTELYTDILMYIRTSV